MKVAVILLNLGGPDRRESIRPFLRNFFMDPAIIPLPRPLRDIASWFIAKKRSRAEAAESYGALGDKSPLLDNTLAQADALSETLGGDFKVFVCMRYWHPMADDVARQVKAYGPDKIVLLPLYPQLSTTTTESSVLDWNKAAAKSGLTAQTVLACCYPTGEGFVKASADNIRAKYEAMTPKPRLLFSAHGVPLFVLKRGDPYVWQCGATARAIVKELGIKDLDWAECYQSRVGPVKWTEPSVEDELKRAAKDGVPVLIYPHAFVSEHVETLVELDEEYHEMAHELGVPGYGRVPTVSTHPAYIGLLADLVHKAVGHDRDVYGAAKNGAGLCPPEFTACACRKAS